MTRYVKVEDEARARRLVNFDVPNIDRTGSVRGMQNRFGWPKGGQVQIGRYIYNVGVEAVKKLASARILHG